jgi:heme A synthase
MEIEKHSASTANAKGLARLCLLLLFSTLGIAGFWHVMYGVSLVPAIAVVGEIAVLVVLAFVCARRWSK